MRIGLYFLSSLLLMIIIGVYANTLNPDTHTLDIFGTHFTLPVYIWVLVPMAILFFFTLLHMLFYGMKNYLFLQKWKNDAKKLEEALYWSLLKEPKDTRYLIKEIGSFAKILKKSTIDFNGSVEGLSEKFTDAIALVKDINRGEYVDLRERGLDSRLSKENPIYIKNSLNRLDVDHKFAEEVLQNQDKHTPEVIKKALMSFAGFENFSKAKKYIANFDIDSFFVMAERCVTGEDLGMDEETIETFAKELKFGCKEFMRLARITSKLFTPDQNLNMFRRFQSRYESAGSAYISILFEYEMLDAIQEYLDEHPDNEFMRYRALYSLKKTNSRYKIDNLVNSYAICYDD